MAGSFRIAEGYVEVGADESAYDRAMARLKSKNHTIKIGVDLDDKDALAKLARLARDRIITAKVNVDESALSRLRLRDIDVNVTPNMTDAAYRRVEAQLDRLTKDRMVRILASADTRVAADEIRNLTQRRRVRIGIDVDTRVAADDIANLTRRRTMRVVADADTAAARARLDALTRDRRANVRVDVDRSALSSLGGGGAGLGGLVSSLTSLSSIAVGALPTVVSLGQALMQMGPAAAVAAPAVLSLGAAFAAIKVGTSGIGDAFKAAFAPATSSAGAATKSIRQVENAQRSLAKAQQGVKDAEVRAAEARVQAARQIKDAQLGLKNTVSDVAESNRRAAESVAQAEQDLANAQRAARQAQLDLTQARKDAAVELEDLNNRLVDAHLGERDAVLRVQDAQQGLDAVKAKGATATQEEKDKAQLEYDKAIQALKEQQLETKRLEDQAASANKAGVEGSDAVAKAKQNVADANQTAADKTTALKDAQIEASRTQVDGAQKIAKAERDLADAREAARKAAVDGARDIKDAQDAVADAARALADAQTSAAASVDKLGDAMAKLSPNAHEFVNAVIALSAAWRGLKLDVQDALFRGLGQTFTDLTTAVVPPLTGGLVGMAGVLNSMAKNAATAVIELAKTGQLKKMFDGLNDGMRPLARIPGQIITGLTQISIAASPAFARLTTAAASAADRISQKLGEAFKSGALEDSINGAIDIAKQFGHLIGDVFGTLGNIMKAAGAAGGDALGGLGAMFKELRKITAMPEVQKALTTIFTAVNAIAKLFATTLGAVIQAALPLLAALAPVITELAEKFGPVLADLAGTLGKALMPIVEALLPIVTDVGGVLVGLVQAVMPLLKPIGDLIAGLITSLAPMMQKLGAVLVPVITVLAQSLVPIVEALVPAFQLVGQFLAQLVPMFPQLATALLPLMPPLAQLVVSLLQLAMQVITPLMPLITGLAGLLAGVLAGAIGILVPVITTVIGWLTTFTTAVTDAVKWIVDKFKMLYDVLVGHSIIPDLVRAIIGWFTSLWTGTKKIFTDLKTWVVNTWKSLWDSVRTKWDGFWGGFRSAISGAWKNVRDSVSGLKTAVTSTWSTMWNSARDKVSSIFSTINGKISAFKSGMKTAFSTLRDSLGTIWDGIKSKIGSPVKWVIANVYGGIRRMWNTIAGKINSKLTLPTISLGFNKGGVVPGTGTGDTVPAMLTPGERILSNQQVAKLGGHRGIDAMLGKDRPTKTGGNPTSQQERKRQQASQGFGNGGIIGTVTGAIGSAVGSAASWAKDLVVGGLKAAAQKAISALIRPLIGQIPGGGFGSLLKGLSNKALEGMLGFLGNEDKKAVGGPAVQRALSWAKTQNGLPYQWAGNGNPSWDCLTLSSVITTPEGHKTLQALYPGEQVMAYQDGKLVSSKVLAKWNTGEQELFKIRTRNRALRATAGHRVLVAAPVARPMADTDERVSKARWGTQWKHVRDLTTSDYLITYTGSPKEGGEEVPEDLAWLMGLWLADGSVHASGGIRICVYGDLAEKTMSVLREHSPDRKVSHHPRHGVMISDIQRARWMIRNGFIGKSHERTVPPVVMDWSESAQSAFLNGYADGDGSYKNGGSFDTTELIEYKATSRELIEGIREMHLRRGDRVSITNTQERTKDIFIGGKKIQNARPIHGTNVAPGRGADQSTGAGHRPGLLRLMGQLRAENMSVQKVLSVEPDGVEETWDIEVEDSHSFVSDGLISHNCSGFMSAIESVIRGEHPHRRWATGAFSGSSGPSGWVRNLNSPFQIGITNAGVGHTAGTIAGMNVESSGGRGVHMGKSARGYNDSLFTSRWGFAPAAKFDSGGLLQPGATMSVNATGKPERVLSADHTAKLDALLTSAGTGGPITVQAINISGTFDFSSPASRKAAANAMVAEMKEALRLYDRGRAR